MNVDKLKPGTKLMWDAPGMSFEYMGKPPGTRIVYPITVTDKTPPNNSLTCHIISRDGLRGDFICGEFENLRYPTQEELNTLTWPKYD